MKDMPAASKVKVILPRLLKEREVIMQADACEAYTCDTRQIVRNNSTRLSVAGVMMGLRGRRRTAAAGRDSIRVMW